MARKSLQTREGSTQQCSSAFTRNWASSESMLECCWLMHCICSRDSTIYSSAIRHIHLRCWRHISGNWHAVPLTQRLGTANSCGIILPGKLRVQADSHRARKLGVRLSIVKLLTQMKLVILLCYTQNIVMCYTVIHYSIALLPNTGKSTINNPPITKQRSYKNNTVCICFRICTPHCT